MDGMVHIDQIHIAGENSPTLELNARTLSPEDVLLGLEDHSLVEMFDGDTPHYVLDTW